MKKGAPGDRPRGSENAEKAPRSLSTEVCGPERRADSRTRQEFSITLRPLPGVDGVRSLRAFLKEAKRRHGLQCVALREIEP